MEAFDSFSGGAKEVYNTIGDILTIVGASDERLGLFHQCLARTPMNSWLSSVWKRDGKFTSITLFVPPLEEVKRIYKLFKTNSELAYANTSMYVVKGRITPANIEGGEYVLMTYTRIMIPLENVIMDKSAELLQSRIGNIIMVKKPFFSEDSPEFKEHFEEVKSTILKAAENAASYADRQKSYATNRTRGDGEGRNRSVNRGDNRGDSHRSDSGEGFNKYGRGQDGGGKTFNLSSVSTAPGLIQALSSMGNDTGSLAGVLSYVMDNDMLEESALFVDMNNPMDSLYSMLRGNNRGLLGDSDVRRLINGNYLSRSSDPGNVFDDYMGRIAGIDQIGKMMYYPRFRKTVIKHIDDKINALDDVEMSDEARREAKTNMLRAQIKMSYDQLSENAKKVMTRRQLKLIKRNGGQAANALWAKDLFNFVNSEFRDHPHRGIINKILFEEMSNDDLVNSVFPPDNSGIFSKAFIHNFYNSSHYMGSYHNLLNGTKQPRGSRGHRATTRVWTASGGQRQQTGQGSTTIKGLFGGAKTPPTISGPDSSVVALMLYNIFKKQLRKGKYIKKPTVDDLYSVMYKKNDGKTYNDTMISKMNDVLSEYKTYTNATESGAKKIARKNLNKAMRKSNALQLAIHKGVSGISNSIDDIKKTKNFINAFIGILNTMKNVDVIKNGDNTRYSADEFINIMTLTYADIISKKDDAETLVKPVGSAIDHMKYAALSTLFGSVVAVDDDIAFKHRSKTEHGDLIKHNMDRIMDNGTPGLFRILSSNQ